MGPHRLHVCAQWPKGVKQIWGVRRTCIHELMHIHIVTKVWDQMRSDWDIHMGLHRVYNCVQLCKGVGADVQSQGGMHTWTNACTHSNQGIRWDERWLQNVHGATLWQSFPCNYANAVMQMWEQVMAWCSGVGTMALALTQHQHWCWHEVSTANTSLIFNLQQNTCIFTHFNNLILCLLQQCSSIM